MLDLDRYVIESKLRESWNRTKDKLFTAEEQKKIAQMAKEFNALLGRDHVKTTEEAVQELP